MLIGTGYSTIVYLLHYLLYDHDGRIQVSIPVIYNKVCPPQSFLANSVPDK